MMLEQDTGHTPPLGVVVLATAMAGNMSKAQLLGPTRNKSVVRWRQAGIVTAYQYHKWSLPKIGHAFDRDHTTVFWALYRAGISRDTCFSKKFAGATDETILSEFVPAIRARIPDAIKRFMFQLQQPVYAQPVAPDEVFTGAAENPKGRPARTNMAFDPADVAIGGQDMTQKQRAWWEWNDRKFREAMTKGEAA